VNAGKDSEFAQARRILGDLQAYEGEQFILPPDVRPPAHGDLGLAPATSARLEEYRLEICECQNCPLGKTRRNFVFGSGSADVGIMFVGEAPGADEDLQGLPFVGKAGQLLTKIIEAMGLRREEVYICNVLKCRPPGNRDPNPEEIAACEPYLKRQIEIVQPRIICTLGRISTQALLKTSAPMRALRGMLHEYAGIPLIATYHPAALLRNPQWKRGTWEDMKWLRSEYDGVKL
jgi:uracil-DNA glycosylase family 4